MKGKNSAQAPSYSQVSSWCYTKLFICTLQIIPAIPMCWETLPENRKLNSILSHSAKSQERAWTAVQRTLCCYPSSQPCGTGPYRLQHPLQFTRALPVLQHQVFPCPNTHFFCTTPLFIFQLPIIWTSYYLVNNSTSLTSFIIKFFFNITRNLG